MKAKYVAAAGPVQGPRTLPDGWRWGRLGEFLSIRDRSINPADSPSKSFQLYSVPSHATGYPEQVVGSEIGSAKQSIGHGDVLLCKINPRINRVWKVVDHECGELIASTEWIRFPATANIEPDYLRYLLMRDGLRNYLAMNASGVGGSLMRVRPAVIEPILVPIAPYTHQKRIVACIDELFAEIDDGEAALARARTDLTTWRKSLLKAAVTGELTADWRAANAPGETGGELLFQILRKRRTTWEEGQGKRRSGYVEPAPPNNTVQPTLPTGWVWASVQQLSQVVRGASPRPAGDPRFFGGTIPWITVGALTRNHSKYLTSTNQFVTELGRDHSRFVPADTLLFTNSGATLGVPRITKIGGCINDGSVALLNMDEPVKSYVYYFLQTQTEKLRALNQGAAQPNLNTTIVKEIRVPLPPIEEVYEIVANIERLLDEQDACEDDIKDLKGAPDSLRQSVLAAAFCGELS
ncbi:restriction endonuclease subunit S [Acetobacteraceae bacterium KSS8]|uniref:Restriction endonuclease subunit S n=1 Tax=Endosaccharibacter trunci TaxID=2812733 RepID=A0ABT1WAM0_9PROT|nr:restriction endonuclease subunit S [Acetobacteraceae bacterium KSS8]